MLIGDRLIGNVKDVFIIAEAGVNHNGSLAIARKLVDAAKCCGADAVKFQTFRSERIATRAAPKAAYQRRTVSGSSQLGMLKRLELSYGAFGELFAYCRKKKITFLSTPFDVESASFLDNLGVCAFKISSGDLNNIPLLKTVAGFRKPVILSTGMADMSEVSQAVRAVRSRGNDRISLLHCTSNYPVKPEDVNLSAMVTMAKRFNLLVGYSDHTEGIEISVAAAAMGASIIEKHITLNKSAEGPDHAASLDPHEFGALVSAVRNVSKAIGDGRKMPRRTESGIRDAVRKSVVAACDIRKGQAIREDMLDLKRPGTGIEPKFLGKIAGRTAATDIKKDELLKWSTMR